MFINYVCAIGSRSKHQSSKNTCGFWTDPRIPISYVSHSIVGCLLIKDYVMTSIITASCSKHHKLTADAQLINSAAFKNLRFSLLI